MLQNIHKIEVSVHLSFSCYRILEDNVIYIATGNQTRIAAAAVGLGSHVARQA